MGTRVKSEDRREQIIDTALRQLAMKGYDATTMVSIAAELGIDRVIIYRQFADFDELFGAVVDHARRLIEDAVTEAGGAVAEEEEVDADTRSRAFFSSLIAAARARPDVWRFLRNAPSGGDPRLQVAALNDELATRVIGELVTRGSERRPALSNHELTWGAAFLYNGAFGALAAHLDHQPESTDAEFVAFVSQMIRRVLA